MVAQRRCLSFQKFRRHKRPVILEVLLDEVQHVELLLNAQMASPVGSNLVFDLLEAIRELIIRFCEVGKESKDPTVAVEIKKFLE